MVTSSDFDLDVLTLIAQSIPANSAFIDSGNGHGLFTFDPDFSQSGIYPIRFIVSDGALADSQMVNITVNNVNLAPAFDPFVAQVIDENSHLEYLVTATDFDNDPLTLSVVSNPLNSSFADSGDGNGLFIFDPDYTQAGVYNIMFTVSDNVLADTGYLQITVNDINAPPEIQAIAPQNVDEGQHLEFVVSSSDVDSDPLSLLAENLPLNSTFDDSGNGHGLFSFDPDFTQSGAYPVRFIASDGTLSDTLIVDITVAQVNLAPVVDAIPPQVVDEGAHLEYVITASDFDADPLILSMENFPLNSAFIDSGNGHGLFTFDPDFTQENVYNISFIANDGSLADTAFMSVTVNHFNTPPVLSPIGPKTVAERGRR